MHGTTVVKFHQHVYRTAQFCCSHWKTVQQNNKTYQTKTPQNKGSRAVHGSLVLHLHQLHHVEVNGLPWALNSQHCIYHMLKPTDQLRDNHRDITVQLPHKEQTCILQCLGIACKMMWMHEKREKQKTKKKERKKGVNWKNQTIITSFKSIDNKPV